MSSRSQRKQEAKTLPDNLGAAVLDFIGYLKPRHPVVDDTPPTAAKIDELEGLFAPYRRDLSGFRFDREEANER